MDQGQVNALIAIVVAVAFGFTAGATTIAAVLVLVFKSLLNSPVLIALLEKLYSGLSPEWQEALKLGAKVLDETTDGTPNEATGAA